MDSAIMSAMHASHLHGQGAKSKHKYQYSRQRVQDTQKAKSEESEPTKVTKKESPPKASRSNKGVILVLLLMIGITWGIAATSYFGVVDYKALIDQAYDAYFNEDPYEIIDKRRPVTGTSPCRQMKRSLDVVRKDKLEEPTPADIPVTAAQKKDVDQGNEPEPPREEVEQPEQPKQKPKDEPKPDSKPETPTKSETTAKKGEADKRKGEAKKGEEDKGRGITLNLYLQFGAANGLAESDKRPQYSAVIKVDTSKETFEIDSLKKQIDSNSLAESENSTECPLHGWIVTKILSGRAAVNKLSKMAAVQHPMVRRLVLVGSAVNRKGYIDKTENSDEKLQGTGSFGRTVVVSTPVPSKLVKTENSDNIGNLGGEDAKAAQPDKPLNRNGPRVAPLPPKFVKIENSNKVRDRDLGKEQKKAAQPDKALNRNGPLVAEQEVFAQRLGKIVVVVDPTGVTDDKFALDPENDEFKPEYCGKMCALGLKFLNRNPSENMNVEEEAEDHFEGRMSVSDFLLNKIHDLEQKISENEDVDGLFSRVALPNPVNKKFEQENDEKVEFAPKFAQKMPLQSPLNKHFIPPEILGNEIPESVQAHPHVRITLPNTLGKGIRMSPQVYKGLHSKDINDSLKGEVDRCETCRVTHPNTVNRNFSELEVEYELVLSVGIYKSVVQNCQVPHKGDNLKPVPAKKVKNKKKTDLHTNEKAPKPNTQASGASDTEPTSAATRKVDARKAAAKGLKRSSVDKKVKSAKINAKVTKEAKAVVSEVVSGRVIIEKRKSRSRVGKVAQSPVKLVTGSVSSKAEKPGKARETLVKARGHGKASSRIIEHVEGRRRYSTKMLFARIISDHVEPQTPHKIPYTPKLKKSKKGYKWEQKRRVPSKRGVKIDLGAPKTPKAKLRRMLAIFYEKSVDFSATVITSVRNNERLNGFLAKIESNMPTAVTNFTKKVKNSPAFAKIINIVANTTVSDAVHFVKTNGKKGWDVISRRSSRFYQKMARKPAVQAAASKFAKFARKMKMKFQKFTDFVMQNIVTSQLSQKLVALFLLTLALVGFYHIFALIFNASF